jgi:hypothetical protein
MTPMPSKGSMKHIVLTSLAITVLFGSRASTQTITPTHGAATPLRLGVRSDSRLWLEGSSNLRDWRCDATTLDATVDVEDLPAYGGASSLTRLRDVQVRVPTHALTCGRSQMDNIMYKALHVDDEPDCRQIIGRFDVIAHGPDGTLVMQGTLRIAGREQMVRLPVVVQQQRDGSLRAQGALPIMMTDYGIKPPTALFGVLRTENRIVVKFDLLVDQSTTLAAVGER